MQMDCVTIEKVVGGKAGFHRNVCRQVVLTLMNKGRLSKGENEGKGCVLVDDEFRRTMEFGIERFVYGQESFSFTAIKAPIEKVAKVLKKRSDVLTYTESTRPVKLRKNATVSASAEHRDCFLLKTKASEWAVLVQTVHWIQSIDMLMSVGLAASLSAELRTEAIAVWDDDFSGSTVVLCDKGKKKRVLSTEMNHTGEFYGFFYEQGISLDECFVMSDGKKTQLGVADPKSIERVDHVVLAVPSEWQTKGPHVGYKLGMMTEAMEEEVENEADFVKHMVDGLWKQAQVMLKVK